jgi:hypothetical protein
MRKKIACGLLLLAGGGWAAGCKTGERAASGNIQGAPQQATQAPSPGAGANVEATLTEVNSFTEELLRKIEGAPDPAAGLGAAQQFFEARRDELRAKIVAARRSREARESAEAKGRLLENEVDNTARLSGLRTKYLERMNDDAFKAKLDRLVEDYQELFRE